MKVSEAGTFFYILLMKANLDSELVNGDQFKYFIRRFHIFSAFLVGENFHPELLRGGTV
jgi:hypothetical protein